MNTQFLTNGSCGLAVVFLIGSTAVASSRYVAKVLEDPNLNSIVPKAINNDGMVTGFAYHGSQGPGLQPFFWQDGELQLVPSNWEDTSGHCFDTKGNAYGIAPDNDSLIYVTKAGVEPLASAPLTSSSKVTHVTSSGYVGGNIGSNGFLWHPQDGYHEFSPSSGWPNANLADVNEAGIAVGTMRVGSGTESKAFYYSNNNMVYMATFLEGSLSAVSIDENNRILILQDDDDGITLYYTKLNSEGLSMDPPIASLPGVTQAQGMSNDAGDIIVGGRQGGKYFLWLKPAGSSEFQEFESPAGSLDLELLGINETGTAWGQCLNQSCMIVGFFLSMEHGLIMPQDRVIGEDSLLWGAAPVGMNDNGEALIFYDFDTSYGSYAVLEHALDGDADGDGAINITDIVIALDAWGPQSDDAICGPDMDMDGKVDVNDLLEILGHYQP